MAFLKGMQLSQNESYDIVISGGGLKIIWAGSFLDQFLKSGFRVDNIYATSSGATLALAALNNVYEDFISEGLRISRSHQNWQWDHLFSKEKKVLGFQESFESLLDYLLERHQKQFSTKVYFNTIRTQGSTLEFYRMAYLLEREMATLQLGHKINKLSQYEELVFDLETLQNPVQLKRGLLATATIPPFIGSSGDFSNCFDGGLISPLPLHLWGRQRCVESSQSLKKVLLLANNRKIIEHGLLMANYMLRDEPAGATLMSSTDFIGIYPSENIPVSMWGYSQTSQIAQTSLLGKKTFQEMIRL